MMDLRSQVQIALQDAGYTTWLGVLDDFEAVGFEDDAVMGFACIFDNVDDLLREWQIVESRLLSKHASAFQRAGEKTWNVYSVFLCQEEAEEDRARAVRWIEENMERTRKLAACGIVDNHRLLSALLPLLPLQSQPALDSEDFDATKRLNRRIESIAPDVAKLALDPAVSANEVVRLLGVEA